MLVYQVGNKITLKKGHPCGENLWKILRTGVDTKSKYTGYQHTIWLPRLDFEKRVRKVQEGDRLASIVHHKEEDWAIGPTK